MQETVALNTRRLCRHKGPAKFEYRLRDGQAYWYADGQESLVGDTIAVLYDSDSGGIILKHGQPEIVNNMLEKYRNTPFFHSLSVATFDVNKNGVQWLNDSLMCSGSFNRFAAMQIFIDEYTIYDYHKASLGEGRLAEKFAKSPAAMMARLIDHIVKGSTECDS